VADRALRFNGPLGGRSMSSPPSRWDLAVLAAKGSACRVGFRVYPLRPCCRMSDLWLASHYGGAMEGSRHDTDLPRLPGTELM
jgi:hypothetical protein